MSHQPADLERCPGCGGAVPRSAGSVHDYIAAAPGCWALYSELTGRDQVRGWLRPERQLLVDAYAVQHPGEPSRRSRQSVCVHLQGLCRTLERGGDPGDGPEFLQSRSHRDYPWLEPPTAQYPVTVVDVGGATDLGGYLRAMWAMARATWEAWTGHHSLVRGWVDDPSTLPRRLS